jgi:predicted transcriptional regulator
MAFTRAVLFENVVMKLSVLRYVVRSMSGRNLTDVNRRCENFFCGILNLVFDLSLVDLNLEEQNAAAIDLGDKNARVCFQVTATSASTKVHDAIAKFLDHKLDADYDKLKFLMLVEKKGYTTTFDTKGRFVFDKKTDILDVDDLLDAVEKLSLERLTELSEFIDAHLHPVTRALSPKSLLAQAEVIAPKEPKTARAFLDDCGVDDAADRKKAMSRLLELHRRLAQLSHKQRELIAFMIEYGKESEFGSRVAMGIQTLQQKLNLDDREMRDYYDALHEAGFLDLDSEERAKNFELTYALDKYEDAFYWLRGFLKGHDELQRVFVDLDFAVLDAR